MATMNPFDLLGDDDAEDPSQPIAAQQQKLAATPSKAVPPQPIKAGAQVQETKPATLPSKPTPPAQAVRDAKNEAGRGGGRGGGGGYGYSRGRRGGGGYNHESSNYENTFSNSGAPAGQGALEDGDGKERHAYGGPRGPYRGGRRGGFGNAVGDGERRGVFERRSGTENPFYEGTSSGTSAAGLNTWKIMSYNVWFREDLEMHKRMKALGDLIQQHCPDVICLQEVTPNIYDIFRKSSWWKMYQCSVSSETANSSAYFCMQLSKLRVKSFSCKPFGNTVMGRELCVAEVEVEKDKHLVVATSHLESPCPSPPTWDQMFSKERVEQAKEAVNFLKKNPNVIFCGDMNWDDELDGKFPLTDRWVDAWEELKPGEDGWTYDTKSNKMLTGNWKLQKRPDRFLCGLHDFRVSKIEMIGMDAIPGLSYIKEKKVKTEIKKLELPVLPSDHYGLLLTICSH